MHTLRDFDFHLPEELIAQRPASPRDQARLLVYDRATKSIRDDIFRNVGNYLPAESTIVLNNSRVEKARMVFDRTEVFILRTANDRTIEALVRPGRKFKLGKTIELSAGLSAKTTHIQEDGVRTLELDPPLSDPRWEPFRLTPFPPYIAQNEDLSEEYQTVYAKDEGSKAAPTAGLHFTEELLERLSAAGHPFAELTLHVGMGTFAPVKSENIDEHIMHSEWYSISDETTRRLNAAKHITAVGTTSARVLESVIKPVGNPGDLSPWNSRSGTSQTSRRHFPPGSGTTDIFIRPGYRYRAVDALITNFHLPKSTLLMLVAALTGHDEMHRIYRHAIAEGYRFYSFGDAMLLL
jgi:S-adenosylmethionine:tRNA ribosyltransferase-isomerase